MQLRTEFLDFAAVLTFNIATSRTANTIPHLTQFYSFLHGGWKLMQVCTEFLDFAAVLPSYIATSRTAVTIPHLPQF